jgi:hypothetical protein
VEMQTVSTVSVAGKSLKRLTAVSPICHRAEARC